VVLEKSIEKYFERTSSAKNENHRRVAHKPTSSEYSLGVATLMSVGTLTLASVAVAVRLVAPRVKNWVGRQVGSCVSQAGDEEQGTPAVALFPTSASDSVQHMLSGSADTGSIISL
jgi:hypothetical protein